MHEITVICAGLGCALLSAILVKRKVKKLPDLSDDVFVKKFNDIYKGVSKEAVLRERDSLASQLGIPCQKLDPSYTFDELSKHLDSFGSYQLAIGDLENTTSELFEKLGVNKPYKSPSNIGEFIHEIIKVKTAALSG
ncbi:MAG: hypothetical protein PHY09_02150 [Desulfuromonadaceae bacterium]|nr:hypothetical protein [Desulfuromonadaceae bacterium]MDD5105598.1 hypothetical protein [Desulfuromonadaceae bacterium]